MSLKLSRCSEQKDIELGVSLKQQVELSSEFLTNEQILG